MITITEVYVDGVKIKNMESKDLNQQMEHIEKHFGDMDRKTSIPSFVTFDYSLKGVLDAEDAGHAKFLIVGKQVFEVEHYLGEKGKSIGYSFPATVDNCNISHPGGGVVEIDLTFKEAGVLTLIQP